jgi:hypothetical protein
MNKHECAPENAEKMLGWIKNRGGVAIWPSINFSNFGASWSTPALTTDGKPYPKPTWQAANEPSRAARSSASVSAFAWDRRA